MEEIKTEEYTVTYDPETAVVTLEGKLRLYDYTSYQPLETMLHEAILDPVPTVTLDIQALEFINSSGLDVFFRFAHKVSRHKGTQLVVRRSNQPVPWQTKLLSTMEMMTPGLQVEIVEAE